MLRQIHGRDVDDAFSRGLQQRETVVGAAHHEAHQRRFELHHSMSGQCHDVAAHFMYRGDAQITRCACGAGSDEDTRLPQGRGCIPRRGPVTRQARIPQISVFDQDKLKLNDRDVAGNAGQGWRSTTGLDGADQWAEIRAISPAGPGWATASAEIDYAWPRNGRVDSG
jgi:hypothetical protein